jgi:hypothetical protein
LHKKSPHSTKGAEYKSQGQVRSEAERVAPGKLCLTVPEPRHAVVFNLPKNRARMIVLLYFERL